MREGCEPATDWVGGAGTAEDARRWRSTWNLETGQRSAAGQVGSCDAGKAAGSGHGSGSVGDGVVAAAAVVVVAGGAAASVGAVAGAVAGSSVMR